MRQFILCCDHAHGEHNKDNEGEVGVPVRALEIV